MKLFILSLCLTLAVIPRWVRADGAAILAAEQKIGSDAVSFNETVANWNGDLLTIIEILSQSTTLLNDINDATATAQASANLTEAEALTLATETETLVSDVQSTLSTIISKKPVFERTLTAGVALLNLQLEKSASDKFSAAVLAKIPPALQSTAASLTAPLDTAFDSAISDFETL